MYIVDNVPLKRVLRGHDIYGDAEAHEIVQFLNVSLIVTAWDWWEPLNRALGPPPNPSIEEAPKLELKELPAFLRYALLGKDKILPVIFSNII